MSISRTLGLIACYIAIVANIYDLVTAIMGAPLSQWLMLSTDQGFAYLVGFCVAANHLYKSKN